MSSAHASWRRWRMGELDSARDPGAARPATVDAEQRKAFQHQAELQALRNEAREEARREGHREGFEAGRQEGHAQGLEEGRRAGEHETARQRQEALAPLAALVVINLGDPHYYDEVRDHPYFIPACFLVGIFLVLNLFVMRILTNIKV